MWEYRLTWDSQPTWWAEAWKRGQTLVQARDQTLDDRSDFYLVLINRVDVGLKRRGEEGEPGKQLEVKCLNQRLGGWELWEKYVGKEWSALEMERLALALKAVAPADAFQKADTPFDGAERLLSRLRISSQGIEISKKRMQATAGELLPSLPDWNIKREWLAELVQIDLPSRPSLYSLCLETLEPTLGIQPIPLEGAICCAYPELLSWQLSGKTLGLARDISPTSTDRTGSTRDDAGILKDFLLAEHEGVLESLWRNEEVGEKRLQFFVGLVTAVVAGLGVLATSEHGLFANNWNKLAWAAFGALLFLLAMGAMTLGRLRKRDSVTDEYKKFLDAIRECFIVPALAAASTSLPDLQKYRPFERCSRHECPQRADHTGSPTKECKEVDCPRKKKRVGWLARLVIALNAMLAGAFALNVAYLAHCTEPAILGVVGILSVASIVLIQRWWLTR